MDDLDLGICPPPVLEKRQGTQSVIRAVANQAGYFASESVATFCWNRWPLSFRTGGYFRLEQVATLLRNTHFGEVDMGYLSRLYERATGEPPHEVLVLENGVLIETGVLGSYECFPNGYLPILLSRSRNGWVVFDTGHSASESLLVPADVCCDGDVLYLECETSAQLEGCITRLVRVLRNLNEG